MPLACAIQFLGLSACRTGKVNDQSRVVAQRLLTDQKPAETTWKRATVPFHFHRL